MSFKPHAIIDFSHFKEDELGPVAIIIKTLLTTNALTFPALPVAAATINTQSGAYTTILGTPDYAGKTADLAAARLTLETSLRKDGLYVNSVANGDAVILAKSGY